MDSFGATNAPVDRSGTTNSSPSVNTLTASATPVTPIAVIGIGCRLPGGIESPEQLWEALLRGDDLVTEVPGDRWDVDDYYDPEPGVPGRSVSKWGSFLDDVYGFDLEFFGVGEREATEMDPQHRIVMETSWEAMEHAGLTKDAIADTLTGVFLGLTHADYQLLAADAHAVEGPYGFTGNNFSLASGRDLVRARRARTRADGGHRLLVRSDRDPSRLPQPARAARAIWLWPAAPRPRWTPASPPPGRPRACCLPPGTATPLTSPPMGSCPAKARSWCCSNVWPTRSATVTEFWP